MLHEIRTGGLPPDDYVPPVIGNGDILMMLDESGAQCAELPEPFCRRIGPKPRISLPGRRYEGSVYPLIPFGHIQADVLVDGVPLMRDRRTEWSQKLDVASGCVVTHERYDGCEVLTTSFVTGDRNLVVISKQVNGADAVVRFSHKWHRNEDAELFPRRISAQWAGMDGVPAGLRADFTADGIRDYRGALALFSDRQGEALRNGISTELRVHVPDGGSATAFLLIVDDMDEDYLARAQAMPGWALKLGFDGVLAHQGRHRAFARSKSYVRLPEAVRAVEDVWETCRHQLLGAATRWSVPPGYSHSQWDMRLFHDELFPFYACLTSSMPEEAGRIVDFRHATLHMACSRTGWKGARYPWESIEDGREGLPMCVTVFYQIWHMASIAMCAWQDYRYSRNRDRLADVIYPILRECAEFFRLWALVREQDGTLSTVPCVDLDESRWPVRGALGTLSGALACIRMASRASEILGTDEELRSEWLSLEEPLLRSIPVEARAFVPSPGAAHQALSAIMPVFPFEAVPPGSPEAVRTVLSYHDRCRTKFNWRPTSDQNASWTWNTAWMVTALARMGDGERAGEAILKATHSTNTFGSVNEAMGDDRTSPSVWFNTTAGAYMHAVNEMLLGSWDEDVRLFPAIPASWKDVSFKLAAAGALVVEAEMADGAIRRVKLTRRDGGDISRSLLVPARIAGDRVEAAGGTVSATSDGACVRLDVQGEPKMELIWA